MKISCKRDSFLNAFTIAASVAASRDVKPVLQNVKMTVDKKAGVLLQATDIELGVRLKVEDCEVKEKGEVILPTQLMRSFLQANPGETLQIESGEDKTIVKSDSRMALPTQSPDEFPNVEEFKEESYHEISAKVFREMIRRTIYATDVLNTRYALAGVFIEMIDANIVAVATDGKRLAFQSGIAECVGGHKVETAIYPVKALKLIEKMLSNDDETVKISVSSTRALFQVGHASFFTRLIEGKFPKWRQIIPEKEKRTQIDLIARAFAQKIQQAQLVTSSDKPGVEMHFEKGKLSLNGYGPEGGEADADMAIGYKGPLLKTKVDPKFMLEYLQVFEPEKSVSLFLSDSEDDPIFCDTEDAYSYVVMPLNDRV